MATFRFEDTVSGDVLKLRARNINAAIRQWAAKLDPLSDLASVYNFDLEITCNRHREEQRIERSR